MKPIHNYKTMWEDFARRKSDSYLDGKFSPESSTGFKNFLRERSLMEHLSLEREDVFLDVGCASGRQVLLAASYCQRAVGIDIASAFVDTARAFATAHHFENIEFHAVSAEELPFTDNTFSKVLCAEVLEHVLEPEQILKEIKRVLRPGGLLIVTVPNKNGEGTWWGRLRRVLSGRGFVPIHTFSLQEIDRHGDAHVREFDMESIRAVLRSEGFDTVTIRGVSFVDFPFADKIMNRINRVNLIRTFLAQLEEILEVFPGMARWARHLVVVSRSEVP